MQDECVQIGDATLYHADCLDVLPMLAPGSVDAVVTSPPYNTLPQKHAPSGIHGERRSGVNKWIQSAVDSYEDNRPEGEYQRWLREVISACLQVAPIVWVNHKVRYRNGEAIHPARFLPFPIYSEIIWNRRGSMALNCKRYAPSHECVLGFGRPAFWDDKNNTMLSVWDIGFDRDQNGHPCAFPVELVLPLIESSVRDYTLDPFMGSGTTGVAALRLGRKFIGIEIERKYFDIAVRRITEAANETALFDGPAKVEQKEITFAG